MSQAAHQDQELGLDQGQLPVEVRAAEIDLRPAGTAVSPAAAFARKALRDRRHIDLAPHLRLRRKASADQPADEDLSGLTLEGQPADGFDGARRLADQHDAVVRIAAQDRGGLRQVAGVDTSRTGKDLSVEAGNGRWRGHESRSVPELQGAPGQLR